MHRHRYTVTRRSRVGAPLIKTCVCGKALRHAYGRWVECYGYTPQEARRRIELAQGGGCRYCGESDGLTAAGGTICLSCKGYPD